MRQKVHVLNRITGLIGTAILTDEQPASSDGRPVTVFGDGTPVDSWHEVLPFPMEDELGVPGGNGRAAS